MALHVSIFIFNIHVVTENVQFWQFWTPPQLRLRRNSLLCTKIVWFGLSVAGSLFVFHYNNIISPNLS